MHLGLCCRTFYVPALKAAQSSERKHVRKRQLIPHKVACVAISSLQERSATVAQSEQSLGSWKETKDVDGATWHTNKVMHRLLPLSI